MSCTRRARSSSARGSHAARRTCAHGVKNSGHGARTRGMHVGHARMQTAMRTNAALPIARERGLVQGLRSRTRPCARAAHECSPEQGLRTSAALRKGCARTRRAVVQCSASASDECCTFHDFMQCTASLCAAPLLRDGVTHVSWFHGSGVIHASWFHAVHDAACTFQKVEVGRDTECLEPPRGRGRGGHADWQPEGEAPAQPEGAP